MCTGCHDELAKPLAQEKHARHPAGVEVACTSCHMPDIVYGVLAAHPSHRIEVPDPARASQEGRPDACTACHVDRTRTWAARERARLWRPSQADEPAETSWSEVETQLFAGDPLERALAAHALSRGAAGPAPTRATRRARHRAMLLEVMEHDPYPAVRHFAWRTLLSLAPSARAVLGSFVPEWSPRERSAWMQGVRKELADVALDATELTQLRAQAEAQAIDIGE